LFKPAAPWGAYGLVRTDKRVRYGLVSLLAICVGITGFWGMTGFTQSQPTQSFLAPPHIRSIVVAGDGSPISVQDADALLQLLIVEGIDTRSPFYGTDYISYDAATSIAYDQQGLDGSLDDTNLTVFDDLPTEATVPDVPSSALPSNDSSNGEASATNGQSTNRDVNSNDVVDVTSSAELPDAVNNSGNPGQGYQRSDGQANNPGQGRAGE